MEDEFNSLAIKALSGESTEEESQRLKELIVGNPDLSQEFEAMEKEFPAVMDLFSMIPEPVDQKVEMPEYVRTMLQGEVQRTFSDKQKLVQEKQKKKEQSALGILWKFALVGGLCVCVLTISGVLEFGSNGVAPGGENPVSASKLEPVISLAVLDFIGPLRGGDDDPIEAAIKETWPSLELKQFSETPESKKWEVEWDHGSTTPQVKVLYNLSEGTIEITGFYNGETQEKAIELNGRKSDLVLVEVQQIIKSWYPTNSE